MSEEFAGELLTHVPALQRAALRLVGDRTEAEDLVQDALLQACRFWYQYHPGTNARAWLMTILRRCHINHYRRTRRHPAMVEFDEATDTPQGAAPAPATAGSDPSLADEEVIAAMLELRPRYREALLLSDLEGMPLSEISRRLGIPVGTAKSRIFRARRLARAKLQEHAVAMGYLSHRKAVPVPSRGRRIA